MDANLFAHINLDAELAGSYGVQGTSFIKTFEYLHRYIQDLSLKNPEITSRLAPFIENMQQLVARERDILSCDNSQKAHEALVNALLSQFESTPIQTPFLLPGGWANSNKPGHAMIYQWIKNDDGSLDLSIYNSGAGLSQHEKVSTLDSEQFFPVKTFRIPPPQNEHYQSDLKHLFSQMILAQKPSNKLRENLSNMDEIKLYTMIEHSMAFLKATPIASQHKTLTTAGQISGTCAQRSIHQMLKINFGHLPDYQRFIFDFKMHALREYIADTIKKRTKKISQDIILAIENNIKILQEPGVCENQEERTKIAEELSQLKKQCVHSSPTPSPKESMAPFLELASLFFDHQDLLLQEKTLPTINNSSPHAVLKAPVIEDTQLIEQLHLWLRQAKEVAQTAPDAVMIGIEELVAQFPLPENGLAFHESIPFYHQTSQRDELFILCQTLTELHALYQKSVEKLIANNFEIAKQKITDYLFLCLYDYIHAQHCIKHGLTSHPPFIYQTLTSVIESSLSSYFATHDPKQDAQYIRILNLYKTINRPTQEIKQNSTLDYYKKLIDSEPEARDELAKKCDSLSQVPYGLERDNTIKALYYIGQQLKENVFSSGSPMVTEPAFRSLKAQIEQAISTELFIVQVTHQNPNNFAFIEPRDRWSSHTLTFTSPGSSAKLEENLLVKSQYTAVNKSIYEKALLSNKRLSNEIQITYVDPSERTPFYLKLNPWYQIKLTIDQYSSHLSLLRNPPDQDYLEAILFEPAPFLHALKHDPHLIKKIQSLIEKGLLYFLDTRSLYTQESLFFIRLSFLFHQYCAKFDPSISKKPLSELISRINEQLNLPHPDSDICASLHQYRFLTILEKYSDLKDTEERNIALKEAFVSFFHLQTHTNHKQKNDLAFNFECNNAKRTFNELIISQPLETLMELINHYLRQLTPPITSQDLEGSYPTFFFKSGQDQYQIDLQSGLLFKNNFTHTAVPLQIKHLPIIKNLQLDQENSCFISSDQSTIEFNTPQTSVRIKFNLKKEKTTVTSIYKKFSTHHEPDWYKLTSLVHSLKLPKVLCDSSTQAWVRQNGKEAYITQNGTLKYIGSSHKQYNNVETFEALDEEANPNGEFLILKSIYHEKIKALESPEFVRLHLTNQGKGEDYGCIYFDRYGLTLTIDANKITLPGTTFELILQAKTIFPPNVAQLTFKNDAQQEQCIVAIQRFYVKSSASKEAYIEGEYYPLIHDTENTIKSEELSLKSQRNLLWRYQNTERIMTWPIVNGAPKPSHASDAFYLCYLYLATHEHEKAWDVLEDIRQRFTLTGSEEELTYLSWIMSGLPYTQSKDDAYVSLNTPRDTACKLKALALYTEFLAQGYTPKLIPQIPQHQVILANDAIINQQRETVEKFHKNLSSYIFQNYSLLLNLKPHLSGKYRLNDEESRSLFSHILDVQGALGYEKLHLNLRRLIKELHQLDKLVETTAHIPSIFLKRRDTIQKKLDEQQNILKVRTRLEAKPIDLQSLKPKSLLSYRNISCHGCIISSSDITEKLFIKKSFEEKCTDPIQQLSSSIAEGDFLFYFRTYFRIACREQLDDPERKALHQFCVTYLIGQRFIPLEQQESDIPYLCHILYRILENPGCLKKIESKYNTDFSDIVTTISKLNVSDIVTLQAVDVFEGPLRETQELIREIKQHTPQSALIQTKRADLSTLSFREACISLLNPALFYEYVEAEQTYQRDFNALLVTERCDKEDNAGKIKFECVQKQRSIATELLKSPVVRKRLKQQAQHYQIKPSWEKALKLANQTLQSQHTLDLLASKRTLLTESDLRRCYVQGDLTLYLELTELSEKECHELHGLIHTCITLEVQKQHADRVIQALDKITTEAKPTDFANTAQIIMSSLLPETINDPALMLFQCEENILLRPRQIEALNNLLSHTEGPFSFNQTVEKIIMGGGKSKVILPLLAQKKATGFNLVIIEVPRALIATNHTDLNATSQRLFGQRAYRFEFDRNSDCSHTRLKEIYEQFIDMMHSKSYLVTTGESIQSLELKYLELLLISPEERQADWEKQVGYLDDITHLLKQCADVVIDEVHEGLLLKRKLNYTIGEPVSIVPELIELTVHLYQFIDELSGPFDADMLIEALLSKDSSPLHTILTQLCTKHPKEEVFDSLRAYLSNKKEPDFLEELSLDIKGTLAFHKEQVKMLPQTLSRRYKEHYGPSKRANSSDQERAIAIPYRANDKPNESSRFGNPLETLNYTTQALLFEGLSETLLKQAITQWQQQAQRQFQENPSLGSIDKTSVALLANQYLPIPLSKIDLNNAPQIRLILNNVRYHRGLIYHVLEQNILKQITVEPTILHSDAYNHVSLYHTVQALTGTPTNHTTYDQRLSYNEATSLGTDAYIQEMLKSHHTPIYHCSFDNKEISLDEFLTQLKAASSVQVCSIIDISATLVGQSNLSVAQALSRTFAQQRTPEIQYILYFEEIEGDDVLCAWDIRHQRTIILGTSNPELIDQRLGCGSEARITYYDQAHITGTDLKQPQNGHGLCLIDEQTQLQHFLQGTMRMRGLDEQQRIEIVAPPLMADLSLEAIFERMKAVEEQQLREDNFYAAIAKMNNLIREEALLQIEHITTPQEKSKLARHLESLFMHQQSMNLFEMYGQIYTLRPTEKLLNSHKQTVLQHWIKCIEESPMPIELNPRLGQKMDDIISASLPNCHALNLSPTRHHQNTEVETQQEILKEQEQLVQTAVQTQVQTIEQKPYARQPREWTYIEWLNLKESGITNSKLNSSYGRGDLFSPQIFFSTAYIETCEQMYNPLNAYTKPVHAILFIKTKGQLSAHLITLEEAKVLGGWIEISQNDENNAYWISTTQHSLLEGIAPIGIEASREYQELIEQIRFFNGQTEELISQNAPYFWLTKETSDKIDYLTHALSPIRKIDPASIQTLKNALENYAKLDFQMIERAPFSNFSNKNWRDEFSNARDPEISALTQAAEAYSKANLLLQTKLLSLEDFKDTLIPEQAIPNFEKHLITLNTIRERLEEMTSGTIALFFESLTDTTTQYLINPLIDTPLEKMALMPLDKHTQCLILAAFIHSPFISKKEKFNAWLKEIISELDTRILQPTHTESSIYLILTYTHPTIEILHQMLDATHQEQLLLAMIWQEQTDDALLERILSKGNLSDNVIKAIAMQAKSLPLLKRLLMDYTEAYPQVLHHLQALDKEQILQLIDIMTESSFYHFLQHAKDVTTLPEDISSTKRTLLQKAIYQLTMSHSPYQERIEEIKLLQKHSRINPEADRALSVFIERTQMYPENFSDFSSFLILSKIPLGEKSLKLLLPHLQIELLEQLMIQQRLTTDELILISERPREMSPRVFELLYQYAKVNEKLFHALTHSPNEMIRTALKNTAFEKIDELSLQKLFFLAEIDGLSESEYEKLFTKKHEILTILLQKERFPASILKICSKFCYSANDWSRFIEHLKQHEYIFRDEQYMDFDKFLASAGQENIKLLVENKKAEIHQLLSSTSIDQDLDKRLSRLLSRIDPTLRDTLLEPTEDIQTLGPETFDILCYKNGYVRTEKQINLLIQLSIQNQKRLKQVVSQNMHDLNIQHIEKVMSHTSDADIIDCFLNYSLPELYWSFSKHNLLNSSRITSMLQTQRLSDEVLLDILQSPYCNAIVLFTILSQEPLNEKLKETVLAELNRLITNKEDVMTYLSYTNHNNTRLTLDILFQSDLQKSDPFFLILLQFYGYSSECRDKIIEKILGRYPEALIDFLFNNNKSLDFETKIRLIDQITNEQLSKDLIKELINALPKPDYYSIDKKIVIKILQQTEIDDAMIRELLSKKSITINQEIINLIERKPEPVEIICLIIEKTLNIPNEYSLNEETIKRVIQDPKCSSRALFKILSQPALSTELSEVILAQYQGKDICLLTELQEHLQLTARQNTNLVLDLLLNSSIEKTPRFFVILLNYRSQEADHFEKIAEHISDFPGVLKSCGGDSSLFVPVCVKYLERLLPEASLLQLVTLFEWNLHLSESESNTIAEIFIRQPDVTPEILLSFIKLDAIKATDNLIDALLSKTKSIDIFSIILREKIGGYYSSSIDNIFRKIINDPELGRHDTLLNQAYERIKKCYSYEEGKEKLLEDIVAQQNKLQTSSFRERYQSETGQPIKDDPSLSPRR